MIRAEFLEQIEQYIKANHIDIEALLPKGEIKYSISHAPPPKESIITSIKEKLKTSSA